MGPANVRRSSGGHGAGDIAYGNAAEKNLHVFERRNRNAGTCRLRLRLGPYVVGIVVPLASAGRNQPRVRSLALAQKKKIIKISAAIRFLSFLFGRNRSRRTGRNGPSLPRIHVARVPARVGELAGCGIRGAADVLGLLDGS